MAAPITVSHTARKDRQTSPGALALGSVVNFRMSSDFDEIGRLQLNSTMLTVYQITCSKSFKHTLGRLMVTGVVNAIYSGGRFYGSIIFRTF